MKAVFFWGRKILAVLSSSRAAPGELRVHRQTPEASACTQRHIWRFGKVALVPRIRIVSSIAQYQNACLATFANQQMQRACCHRALCRCAQSRSARAYQPPLPSHSACCILKHGRQLADARVGHGCLEWLAALLRACHLHSAAMRCVGSEIAELENHCCDCGSSEDHQTRVEARVCGHTNNQALPRGCAGRASKHVILVAEAQSESHRIHSSCLQHGPPELRSQWRTSSGLRSATEAKQYHTSRHLKSGIASAVRYCRKFEAV